MGKSILLHYSCRKMVLGLMLLTIVVAVQGKNCSVSRCSDEGPDIQFPFWLKHNSSGQPTDDPGFQLSCGGGGTSELYNKTYTILEYQYLVNTSIKGLQFSLNYKVIVSSIDYKDQYVYLHDTPYLTDIVPIPLLLNSSSRPDPFTFQFRPCFFPLYGYRGILDSCDDNLIISPNLYSYAYTFFNCSSSTLQTHIPLSNNNRLITSLSTREFQVYAYSSYDNIIEMLPNIKSCAKLYNISSKLPFSLLFYDKISLQHSPIILSWSTPVGGGKCEAVPEDCNFDDDYRTPTTDFQTLAGGSDHAKNKRLMVSVMLPSFFFVVLGLAFLYSFIQLEKGKIADELNIKMFMEDYKALKPTRYSYSDIKKITNLFKHKLGQGGYGSVFKGQISSDILVAVKIFHSDPKANGDDFINEVGTIGKIHHVNVVRLLGYCADGCNRALVYEFQPNHSLEKFVYKREKQQSFIGWQKMQQIALGIAKGIEYLHRGCSQQILHFDIKPQNILLDQNLNPKISDFGLAKLCSKGQSIVSMTAARGTIGYIAPEVFSRNFGKVSSKSDVYSFGMLLLEMVGGKNNTVEQEQSTSEVYFPEWIYLRLEKGGEMAILIENEDDSKIARKLTIVGLWCIGWHPLDRPSMKLVIQMLKGDECPAMPPNPFSSTTSANAIHGNSFIGGRLQIISESE